MRTKDQLKNDLLEQLYYTQKHYQGDIYQYYQEHIDMIDRITDEDIANLTNRIIRFISYQLSAFGEAGKHTIAQFFNGQNGSMTGVYECILGLSMSDLGPLVREVNEENINKFINFINNAYDIQMPLYGEIGIAKKEYEENPTEENKKNYFELKRRNGDFIALPESGIYSKDYMQYLSNDENKKSFKM